MPLVTGSPRPTSLQERGAELAVLQTALDDARSGHGRLVVVEGVAGSGRTTLLAAAAGLGERRDMTVLTAAGDLAEQPLEGALLLQLLERPLAGITAEDHAALFAGAAQAAAPLFDGTAAGDGFDAVHGVHRLLANLAARRPLAVVVDDVQWADEAALLTLGYLARRLAELPVALLLGVREGEAGAAEAVVELAADADATVLRPEPLSETAVATLVRERLGEATTAEQRAVVAAATTGNPLLLSALLGAEDPLGVALDPEAQVPEPLVDWVRCRMDGLGADGFAFGRSLAVLGDDVPVAQVATLAGLEAGVADVAAAELAGLGLVTVGEQVGFAAPLLRAAVHATIPAAEGRRAHGRAARLLRRDGAQPHVVAAQLLRAPAMDEAWVVGVLRAQARRAFEAGDRARAGQLLGRVLDEPVSTEVRGTLLAQLGELRAAHAAEEAVELLERALELLSDPHARVDAHRALGDALVAAGRHRDAARVIRDGLELAGDDEPALTRRLQASQVILDAVRPELEVDGALDRLPADPVSSTEERGELVAAAARGCFELEPHTSCISLARRALDGERLESGEGPDADRWAVATAVLGWGDDLPAALDACDTAILRLRRRGNPIGVATARACRATPAYWSGRLDEATADAEDALAERAAGRQPWLGLAGTVLVACHLERWDTETARAVMAEVERRAGDAPELIAHTRFARAQLRLAEGELQDALDGFVAAGTALPHQNPAVLPWRSHAALVAQRLGDGPRAADLADAELELAQRFGAARPIGIALRAAGVVAPDPATAVALLEEAVAVLRTCTARLELARALTDLGTARLAAGDPIGAREPLREALGLADDCGATTLVTTARQQLVRAGGRPRRAAQSGRRALTATERRVAELAAKGLTNREIATRLVVTRTTVTSHLGGVYRKLGITSRTGLKALLG